MAAYLRKALTYRQLSAAFERVRENRGGPGMDGITLDEFSSGVAARFQQLQAEVLGGRYRPQPLKRIWLARPGKPPRPLGVPAVRDRVLQTAVAQVINPLLETEFEECSYAYRQGRSVRQAVERIGLLQRQGYQWVVEADIERFFDRIPHARLLTELRAVVPDDELVALVGQWLTAPVDDDGTLYPVTLGVAQGSPISPLLSNLYLDHLDEALLDEDFALVRYADDFVVLTKSFDRAEEAVELTAEILQKLELKLNPLRTRIVNFDTGFKFLGWNFVRSLAVPARREVEDARDVSNIRFPAPPPSLEVIPLANQLAEKLEAVRAELEAAVRGEPEAVHGEPFGYAQDRLVEPRISATTSDGKVSCLPIDSIVNAETASESLEAHAPHSHVGRLPSTGSGRTDSLESELTDSLDLQAESVSVEMLTQEDAILVVPLPIQTEYDVGQEPLDSVALHPGYVSHEDDAGQESPDSVSLNPGYVNLVDEAAEETAVPDQAAGLQPMSVQRTLYLVDPLASLSTRNRRLLVSKEDQVILDLPAINVDQVLVLGRNSITTAALVCCANHGIPVAYLSRMGKFYARLEPPGGAAVMLQQKQFAAQNDLVLGTTLARTMIHAKLSNSTLMLARYARHRGGHMGDPVLHQSILQLRDYTRRLHAATGVESLRGLEGAGAAAYFRAWQRLLPVEWGFAKREQQLGLDPVNALLDFGYSLLHQAVAGLIQARGLNPWLGHLHALKSGHMALASDLMEEFRAPVVDSVVLNICLNGLLVRADFSVAHDGWVLREKPRREFVRLIEDKLNSELRHPHSAELLDMRRIIDAQVRSLMACYRANDAQLYKGCEFR